MGVLYVIKFAIMRLPRPFMGQVGSLFVDTVYSYFNSRQGLFLEYAVQR